MGELAGTTTDAQALVEHHEELPHSLADGVRLRAHMLFGAPHTADNAPAVGSQKRNQEHNKTHWGASSSGSLSWGRSIARSCAAKLELRRPLIERVWCSRTLAMRSIISLDSEITMPTNRWS
jgi:hypothetical protein